jgi:hypothetical protein
MSLRFIVARSRSKVTLLELDILQFRPHRPRQVVMLRLFNLILARADAFSQLSERTADREFLAEGLPLRLGHLNSTVGKICGLTMLAIG